MAIHQGHVDQSLFRAASEGVPQGGVISPLLSNIMLNEFDQWLDAKYLSKKARKDRWYCNRTIKQQRPIAIRENWKWMPAVETSLKPLFKSWLKSCLAIIASTRLTW
jgi:RNA-directed DNA polymerase